jgi:dephospho-CoA kinase
MIKIGILGDIGSGKSHIARSFGYPVFNADKEVSSLYKKDKVTYLKLKKVLPNYLSSFPIDKKEISKAILTNKSNLKKIVKIVHLRIRKRMKSFLKKNKSRKIVILDIPLLLENNINRKNDILVFVQSRKFDILKRLKKRKNFNQKLLNKFKSIQLPLDYKKKKSQFIIKNNFTDRYVKKDIQNILKEIL